MANQQPIDPERLEGRKEIFKLLDVMLQSGPVTSIGQNDRDYWLNVPTNERTKNEIDLQTSRQLAAQHRETVKVQNEVLANESKISEALGRLKNIFGTIN